MLSGLKTDIGIGSRGKGNEDNLIVLNIHVAKGPNCGIYHLLLVADGMGGLKKGEIASALAIKGISKTLLNRLIYDKSHFSPDEKSDDPALLLKECIEISNLLVYNYSKRENTGEMGSTIVAGLIKNCKLFIGHVGDSRAYLIRREKIERLTTDHSLVQALYESHILNTSEMYNHPHKNVITRAIGFMPKVEVEVNEKRNGNPVTLQKKDFILLCSDGVSNILEEQEILSVVKKYNYKPQKVADELINLSNKRETDDNATVLCTLMEDDDFPAQEEIELKLPREPKRIQTKIQTVILPQQISCRHCGKNNFTGDIICKTCGKTLLEELKKPRILIINGMEAGKNIIINKEEIYIGRDQQNNDVFIIEPPGKEYISRRHLKIFKRGDDYWAEDLNSSNGTKIRNIQIKGQKIKLQSGDHINIGMNILEFKE